MRNPLTTTEAGLVLDLTRVRVWQLIKAGRLEASKVGRRYLIRPVALRLYLEEEARKDAERVKVIRDCSKLHTHDLVGDYLYCHQEAERRFADGWKQKKCPNCGLWAIWAKPSKAKEDK